MQTYKIYDNLGRLTCCCYAGHSKSHLSGLHDAGSQASESCIWGICVSSVLNQLMASFIHLTEILWYTLVLPALICRGHWYSAGGYGHLGAPVDPGGYSKPRIKLRLSSENAKVQSLYSKLKPCCDIYIHIHTCMEYSVHQKL